MAGFKIVDKGSKVSIDDGGITNGKNFSIFWSGLTHGTRYVVAIDGFGVGRGIATSKHGWFDLRSGFLPEGEHIVQLRYIPRGSTMPATYTQKFTIDRTPPKGEITSVLSDKGLVKDGDKTDDTTLTIMGTGEVGVMVRLFVDQKPVGETKVTTDGSWKFDTSKLTEGRHDISAQFIDRAGNVGSSQVFKVTVDLTPPPPPLPPLQLTIDGVIHTDKGDVESGGKSSVPTLELSGTGTPGEMVDIYLEPGFRLGSAGVTNSGKWSFTTPTLKDGEHSFYAEISRSNPSGQEKLTSTSVSVEIDTHTMVMITSVNDDHGLVRFFGLTHDPSLRVEGIAEVGDKILLFGDTDYFESLGSTIADANGQWTMDVLFKQPPEGSRSEMKRIVAVAEDDVGNKAHFEYTIILGAAPPPPASSSPEEVVAKLNSGATLG